MNATDPLTDHGDRMANAVVVCQAVIDRDVETIRWLDRDVDRGQLVALVDAYIELIRRLTAITVVGRIWRDEVEQAHRLVRERATAQALLTQLQADTDS